MTKSQATAMRAMTSAVIGFGYPKVVVTNCFLAAPMR
jgi:hypothetical protein